MWHKTSAFWCMVRAQRCPNVRLVILHMSVHDTVLAFLQTDFCHLIRGQRLPFCARCHFDTKSTAAQDRWGQQAKSSCCIRYASWSTSIPFRTTLCTRLQEGQQDNVWHKMQQTRCLISVSKLVDRRVHQAVKAMFVHPEGIRTLSKSCMLAENGIQWPNSFDVYSLCHPFCIKSVICSKCVHHSCAWVRQVA